MKDIVIPNKEDGGGIQRQSHLVSVLLAVALHLPRKSNDPISIRSLLYFYRIPFVRLSCVAAVEAGERDIDHRGERMPCP